MSTLEDLPEPLANALLRLALEAPMGLVKHELAAAAACASGFNAALVAPELCGRISAARRAAANLWMENPADVYQYLISHLINAEFAATRPGPLPPTTDAQAPSPLAAAQPA